MSPLQSEFLSRVGKALLEIQLTEQLLQICVSYFLPQAATLAEIEAQAEKDRAKTLGELCKLMRARIAINSSFDDQLKQLVADRNEFVHRFLKVEGVSFSTEGGLGKGIEFVKGLEARSIAVRKVIRGLMDVIEDVPKGDEHKEEYKELAKVVFGGN